MSWIQKEIENVKDDSKENGLYVKLGDKTRLTLDLQTEPISREVQLADGEKRTYRDWKVIVDDREQVLSCTPYLYNVLLREMRDYGISDVHSSVNVEIRKSKNDKGHTQWTATIIGAEL